MNTYYNYDYNFLSNFENVYKNMLIYRSIIVVNNLNDIDYLKKNLINCDHTVFVIKDNNIFNNNFNFNKLDKRVIIIPCSLFVNFIDYLNDNDLFSSFSLIAYYNIDNLIKLLLTSYYNNITNNYCNTIII